MFAELNLQMHCLLCQLNPPTPRKKNTQQKSKKAILFFDFSLVYQFSDNQTSVHINLLYTLKYFL